MIERSAVLLGNGVGLLFVALPTLPHLLVLVARSLHHFGLAFLRAARILVGDGRTSWQCSLSAAQFMTTREEELHIPLPAPVWGNRLVSASVSCQVRAHGCSQEQCR